VELLAKGLALSSMACCQFLCVPQNLAEACRRVLHQRENHLSQETRPSTTPAASSIAITITITTPTSTSTTPTITMATPYITSSTAAHTAATGGGTDPHGCARQCGAICGRFCGLFCGRF